MHFCSILAICVILHLCTYAFVALCIVVHSEFVSHGTSIFAAVWAPHCVERQPSVVSTSTFTMGNLERDSKPYKLKLAATKERKQKKRLKKVFDKPDVRKLINAAIAVRTKGLKKMLAESLALNERHLQEKRRAVRDRDDCTGLYYTAKKQLVKCRSDLLTAKQNEEMKDLSAAKKKVKLFWKHIEAHARPGNRKWLEKMWYEGPPPAKDGGTGWCN